jgi:hypothetical protein
MLAFLSENLGTIAAGLVVTGIAAAIIARLVRDKRQGRCAGCGAVKAGQIAARNKAEPVYTPKGGSVSVFDHGDYEECL